MIGKCSSTCLGNRLPKDRLQPVFSGPVHTFQWRQPQPVPGCNLPTGPVQLRSFSGCATGLSNTMRISYHFPRYLPFDFDPYIVCHVLCHLKRLGPSTRTYISPSNFIYITYASLHLANMPRVYPYFLASLHAHSESRLVDTRLTT